MNRKTLIWHDDQPFHLAVLYPTDDPFYFRAAGASFRQKSLEHFKERFARLPHLLAWLWPEPENEFHDQAVRLMLLEPRTGESCQAGYLPRELANEWFGKVREMEEEVGFLPAFPAKFLGGITKAPTVGILVAARHPGEWPKSREELEEVA